MAGLAVRCKGSALCCVGKLNATYVVFYEGSLLAPTVDLGGTEGPTVLAHAFSGLPQLPYRHFLSKECSGASAVMAMLFVGKISVIVQWDCW